MSNNSGSGGATFRALVEQDPDDITTDEPAQREQAPDDSGTPR